MTYDALLERVIKDGITACITDYDRFDQTDKRDGSVRGFNDCRGLDPTQLMLLLDEAQSRCARAMQENADDYWYWRCRALEIEWVCNVVSAALGRSLAAHLPTMRGAMKAGEILGVAE